MIDTQLSRKMRLTWVGLAFLLHAALLFAVPRGSLETARFSAPIQVSLLDPAPVSESSAQTPLMPEPSLPVPKPLVKPRQIPELQAIPKPETPLSDIPAVEPVMTASASTNSSAPARDSGVAESGEALTEASFDAAYLRNPKPVYPPMSQRLREEGKVMLRVFVLPDGSPQDIEIKRSSGSVRLDEAAKATVHRWRFVPARRGNAAVAAWVVVPIVFKLEF
ncbi:MAG: TonB family protein [Zoogloeaceae bacterium]|nr:TonB family protein [Zoogloeaceae bacterium]